jgi:hypothetical protein
MGIREAPQYAPEAERMAGPVGLSVTQEDKQPMIADCVLLAAYDFRKDFYDTDVAAGHPRLGRNVQMFKQCASSDNGVVGELSEDMKAVARKLKVTRDKLGS